MKGTRAVVIEDETDILEVITYNLERVGIAVEGFRDGEEGLRRIRERCPDVVLLDLMLPGMSGLEICRCLREDPTTRDVSLVMVTARGEESDIVHGFQVGADDYIPKPFSPRELLARVQAVLRRGSHAVSDRIRIDEAPAAAGVVVDLERHEVRLDGKPGTFTATEIRLLHTLKVHAGQVLSRDQLIDRAMGRGVQILDRNIDVHIGNIRKKLGAYRGNIRTVRGVGYSYRDAEGVDPTPEPGA